LVRQPFPLPASLSFVMSSRAKRNPFGAVLLGSETLRRTIPDYFALPAGFLRNQPNSSEIARFAWLSSEKCSVSLRYDGAGDPYWEVTRIRHCGRA